MSGMPTGSLRRIRRAIIYARVSTEEQAEHGYSLQTQLEACRRYAEEHGLEVAIELQDDMSGAILARPGLDQTRGMLERGEADALIVYDLDRLTRKLAHEVLLREEFEQAGVELHVVRTGPAEATPEGRLRDHVQAVIAEYEREKIRERSKRNRVAKATSGKMVGDAKPPYGYARCGRGREFRIVIDQRSAEIVRKIFALYTGAPRYSLRALARELNRLGIPSPGATAEKPGDGWCRMTVLDILRRPAYIGDFKSHGVLISSPDLAIVDREVWEAAQRRIAENKQTSRRNRRHHYLLAGARLRCTCGRSMSGRMHTRNGASDQPPTHQFQYVCTGDWDLMAPHPNTLSTPMVDELVWGWLVGVILNPERLEAALVEAQSHCESMAGPAVARLAEIDTLIAREDKRIKRLVATFGDADDAEFETIRAEVDEARRDRAAYHAEQLALRASIESNSRARSDRVAIHEMADEIQDELVGHDTPEFREWLVQRINLVAEYHADGGSRWLWVDSMVGAGRVSLSAL